MIRFAQQFEEYSFLHILLFWFVVVAFVFLWFCQWPNVPIQRTTRPHHMNMMWAHTRQNLSTQFELKILHFVSDRWQCLPSMHSFLIFCFYFSEMQPFHYKHSFCFDTKSFLELRTHTHALTLGFFDGKSSKRKVYTTLVVASMIPVETMCTVRSNNNSSKLIWAMLWTTLLLIFFSFARLLLLSLHRHLVVVVVVIRCQ